MQAQQLKTATERLDDLYKWLLTPTTFLVLTMWSELTYIVTHQEKMNVTSVLSGLTESDLLWLPVRRLPYDVTPLVFSVFIFLMFASSQRGKVWIVSRSLSFWLLTYTFASVGFAFLPAFPSGFLRTVTLVPLTGVVSILVVLDAHLREKGTTLFVEVKKS